jgi:hypothetical protein
VSSDDQGLYYRVCAEFTEMPGLALTLAQASRLFQLDVSRCERVLAALVRQGELTQRGSMFRRPGGMRGWS